MAELLNKTDRRKIATTRIGDIYLRSNGDYEFDVSAGIRISDACDVASLWASINDADLRLHFNGIELTATQTVTGAELWQQYSDEMKRRSEAYKASPRGIADAKREAANTIKQQGRVDQVVSSLPGVLASPSKVLALVCQLADAALVSTTCDYGKLADVLETQWKGGAHVGVSPDKIKASKQMMAEYIVGQAINCLRSNMPPHPMVMSFTEEWKQM